MEGILQSIVKIIIIGSLYETTNCNRQFLAPPLPYYQNDDYYIPGFVPPYYEPHPIYYKAHNSPPSMSYQNINSFTPSQLFYQNENYNPALFANPDVKYFIPPTQTYRTEFSRPRKPPQKSTLEVKQILYKKPGSPAGNSHKKPAFYATNIIVKEESHSPYYHDDYNKNVNDEDYVDNYSDDTSSSDPCANPQYRYFELPKSNPNNPIFENKFTLCNPYVQPGLGNNVYTVKMPITLLPSQFPPRVEQFIERIQNYFSTYTQKETQKPPVLVTSTTIQPTTSISSENNILTASTPGDLNKKNKTEENTEEINLEPTDMTTTETVDQEKVTQKTIVVTILEEEKALPTVTPDVNSSKEPQMALQSTQIPSTVPVNLTQPEILETGKPNLVETSTEIQILPTENEISNVPSETKTIPVLNHMSTSEVTENPELVNEQASSVTVLPEAEITTENSAAILPTTFTIQHEVTDNNG